jgi:LPXTG-motif cell wall-anchored protein
MSSRWLSRLAVAAAAAGAVTLMTATSAWAVDPVTINLHPDHDNVTAKGFDGDTCDGPFADLPDGFDGWHFVLPSASGDSFVQLNLVFTKSDGSESVTITSTDSNNPSEDATVPLGEWFGYFDNAGAAEKHAYVFTEAGWTLTSGTAQVVGAAADESDVFNLSHTCAGDGTPPTEPPPTTAPPTEPPSTTEPPGNGGSSPPPTTTTPGGGLPVTGTAIGGIVIAGIGLVAAGIALLAIRRRRDIADLTES